MTKKTERVATEMVEMALLLNKQGVLSAHDLGRIKALSSPPPKYSPQRVAQIRVKKAKMSQSVFAGLCNDQPVFAQVRLLISMIDRFVPAFSCPRLDEAGFDYKTQSSH